MAIRTIRIHPDQIIETLGGEQIECVSRERLIEAAVDLAITINLTGGTGTIVTTRRATGVPDEMVTAAAMVQWKDRTDAKPQPEQTLEAAPAPAQPGGHFEDGMFVPDDEGQTAIAVGGNDENPDGLDEDQLLEEDVSSIPEHLRG